MKYKIGIWGQFGGGKQVADGQAVKTIIIAEELRNRYGSDMVFTVDTNNWKKNPLKLLFNTLKMNAKCENICILPADNGFKVCVPLLNLTNIFFRRTLYYVVIGGFLPELLRSKPRYLKMLKKYAAHFPETETLKKDIEDAGLDRVYVLDNLKRLNTLSPEEVQVCQEKEIKVCTFARITEDKGIAYAVEAVKMANEALGGNYIHLDMYGMCAPAYKETFDKMLAENGDFISYGGVVDFNKTTETLKDYFAMLFPTYYYGEGFPGTVIDAYNAALPMIATDWNYNADVIENGVNGILVPIKDARAMCDALLSLYNDRDRAYEIAMNNLSAAEKYKPERVLAKFYSFID